MLKRLSTILLLAGSAALIWCTTVWVSAALFEKYEAWRWGTRRTEAYRPRGATAPLKGTPQLRNRGPRPHDVIAWIEVPRLHISTAVIEGDDNLALSLGAGHIPGTPLPGAVGNVGIAA